MKKNITQNKEYHEWLKKIKSRVIAARNSAAISINIHLIQLYWELGKEIVEKQNRTHWGDNLIEQVAIDLKHEFPDIKGFSRRNLYAVRQWYLFYSYLSEKVPQPVAQIPWGHNRLIISKVHDIQEGLFYAKESAINGWSRSMLEAQIDNHLFGRKGKAITNFKKTLQGRQSAIATQSLKDPYNFDFLGLENDALEKEIEKELTRRIAEFLLELGKGFAFVGNQYKIEISDSDYFIDMLFYHLELRCYIVIELKAGKFEPEYAGKLNFYLSAVDSQLKKKTDNPTIGILLCKRKNKIEAEYALRDINKPIGISEYLLTQSIPEKLKTSLPSIEELENQLAEKIKNK